MSRSEAGALRWWTAPLAGPARASVDDALLDGPGAWAAFAWELRGRRRRLASGLEVPGSGPTGSPFDVEVEIVAPG